MPLYRCIQLVFKLIASTKDALLMPMLGGTCGKGSVVLLKNVSVIGRT